MRICIFTHTFPRFPGDTTAPFMGNFAEALCKEGHEVTVLLPFDTSFKKRVKIPYKIEIYRYIYPQFLHRLGYSRTLKGDKGLKLEAYFLSPFLFLFGFFALLRLVKDKKVDIISSHWIIPNGFIAALVYKITGVPFTVTIPGSDVYLGGKNKLFRFMTEFAAKEAKVVLADNEVYIQQLRALGIKPKRTFIIPYGVNTEKFKPIKKDKKILNTLGIENGTKIILAVGRLVQKKGFLYLIGAMPMILKIQGKVKLVIVGDGDQKQKLLDEVKRLKIEDGVIFAGSISYNELARYYNIGDIFVMPSIRDEFGNIDASPVAMMEAMACGTPVVATKYALSGNFLEKGKIGFIVKDKDSKDISRAVIVLLKRNGRRDREEIRLKAIENFSTTSIAQKYTQVLKLAINNK